MAMIRMFCGSPGGIAVTAIAAETACAQPPIRRPDQMIVPSPAGGQTT